MSDNIEILLHRVERLERQNRAMKLATAAAVLACFAFTSVPGAISAMTNKFPHGPKQLDAQRFNLISAKGTLLASLAQGPNGAYISFWDANQNTEMIVGTSPQQGNSLIGVTAFDGNALVSGQTPGKSTARLIWGENGSFFGESVNDPNGLTRIGMQTASDGSGGGSYYYDASGVLRAGIGYGSTGPGMFLEDANAVTRWITGISPYQSTDSVVTEMFDAGAKPQADLFTFGDDSATSLQFLDPSGVQRLEANNTTATGSEFITNSSSGAQAFTSPPAF